MKRLVLFIGLCVMFMPVAYSAGTIKGVLNKEAGMASISIDGKVFTELKFKPDQKYPYFYPVNGPKTGKSITTETSEPYPHHHSLFFGCDRVNEGNYWQDSLERGRINMDEIDISQREGDSQLEIHSKCSWVRPDAPSPLIDKRTVIIKVLPDNSRIIDFYITLIPLTDVTIENTNHSLFSARVVPELSEEKGGVMINSRGQKDEKETAGKPAEWMDYGGMRDGVFEGIALMDHPKNNWFPSLWFTRAYGFFSPTPLNWLKEGFFSLKKSEEWKLQYRVVVHSGDVKQAKIAELYKEWSRF